jgi:hypothetical protein
VATKLLRYAIQLSAQLAISSQRGCLAYFLRSPLITRAAQRFAGNQLHREIDAILGAKFVDGFDVGMIELGERESAGVSHQFGAPGSFEA